jgi:hypothetical protein
MGGPGMFGSADCSVTISETCGSTTYYATCACPYGTCGCVGPSTSSVVNFTGCPNCPTVMGPPPWGTGITANDVFALCGFPH